MRMPPTPVMSFPFVLHNLIQSINPFPGGSFLLLTDRRDRFMWLCCVCLPRSGMDTAFFLKQRVMAFDVEFWILLAMRTPLSVITEGQKWILFFLYSCSHAISGDQIKSFVAAHALTSGAWWQKKVILMGKVLLLYCSHVLSGRRIPYYNIAWLML